MKKILILMLCCIMYVNNAHSKVCFLASLNCDVGPSKSNKSDNNSNQTECPAEYNLSENQLCEAHKYQTCLNEKTGISLYKDLGCDRAAGYYAINSQTTDKKYICDAEVCGGCCNEFRCSDDYKSCLSEEYENVVGEGDTCTEKHEKYYVNNSPDKFLECNCDTEKYPYSINNCSDTLSGAHCKGDNGVYWKECVKACIGYPYKSCPASAIKCETCESGGVTYYKAIECNESDGYYHSDGECKPRDCSDYEWDTCPTNALCDPRDAFDRGDTYYYNDPCITAGQVKYQLWDCGKSNFHWAYYMKAGTKGCVAKTCEVFEYDSYPENAVGESCHKGIGNAQKTTIYSLENCKPYYHYQNGSCVVYGDAACVNHKLTEKPANANYDTCSPDGGTTKYYQFTYCKSGYNFVDGACVEPSGVTETDYPFTTKEECTNGNFECSYSGVSQRRYKRTRCAHGFHYDNGVCIENDCSAYPFYYNSRYNNNSPYMSGPSCEKPLANNGVSTYIMLTQCSGGYKFDKTTNNCVKSPWPEEAFCSSSQCPENGICANQFTSRICSNSNAYRYWEGCKNGFYFNGEKCVANKCPDFPFAAIPENAATYAKCNKGGTLMYRAKSCNTGYRLNNHGCEKI